MIMYIIVSDIRTRKLHHLILAFNLHRKVYGADQTSFYNELYLSAIDEFDAKGIAHKF